MSAPWEKFNAYRWTRFSNNAPETHPPKGVPVLFVDESGAMGVCTFDGIDVMHYLEAVSFEEAKEAVTAAAINVLESVVKDNMKKAEKIAYEVSDESLWEVEGRMNQTVAVYFYDPMAWMPLPPPPAVLSHDSGSDQFEVVDGTFDVLNAIEPVVRQAIADYLAKGVRA